MPKPHSIPLYNSSTLSPLLNSKLKTDEQTDDTFVRNADHVRVNSDEGGHNRRKRQTQPDLMSSTLILICVPTTRPWIWTLFTFLQEAGNYSLPPDIFFCQKKTCLKKICTWKKSFFSSKNNFVVLKLWKKVRCKKALSIFTRLSFCLFLEKEKNLLDSSYIGGMSFLKQNNNKKKVN